MWIIKIIKIKFFNPPWILDEHWSIYSCLQIPPRENWFQYVRRVYTTAINFPCIGTLGRSKICQLCCIQCAMVEIFQITLKEKVYFPPLCWIQNICELRRNKSVLNIKVLIFYTTKDNNGPILPILIH